MPPKMTSKGNENQRNNVCWLLASENDKLRYVKHLENQCANLYLPKVVSESPKRSSNDKSMNESNQFLEETFLDVFVADDTLFTALRIQPGENSSMVCSSTKL